MAIVPLDLMNPQKIANKGIGKVVLVIVILVVVLAAGGAASALLSPPSTTSSNTNQTSSTSQSGSSSASLASSSSTTAAGGSNNGLSITVTQVITDTVESSGYTYWIMTVTLTDTGNSQHYVNPSNFQLTSNTNAVYQWNIAFADQNDLQEVTLNAGQHTSGQIAFKLPNDQSPSMLEYSWSVESVDVKVTSFPASSGVVSYVSGNSATVSGTASTDVSGYVSVENSSDYFYTGQVIALKVALNNYDTASHTVSSISISGLTVISMTPSTPITVGNSEVDVTIYAQAPATAFNRQVNATITTSS